MKKLFLPGIFLLLLASCQSDEERLKPEITSITESIYASGSVKAAGQYDVRSTVGGTLKQIMVEEGDAVNIGDTLFWIDNVANQLSEENARIAYELALKNAGSQSARYAELEYAITLAKDQLQQDSALFVRQSNLWKKNIGSKLDYDQRQLAYQRAQSNYNTAKSRYAQYKDQVNSELRQAENMLKLSQKQTRDYMVVSAIEGVVYDLLIESGELVNTQQAIAIVGSADEFILEMKVDEYDIVKAKVGQQVLVNMDSYKEEVFQAKLTKIYPIMDAASRTFKVEAIFSKAPPKLYPNLTIEANVVIQTKENVLVIPRSYLVDDSYVLMEEGEKLEVKTGLMNYQQVEILSGIDSTQFIYLP